MSFLRFCRAAPLTRLRMAFLLTLVLAPFISAHASIAPPDGRVLLIIDGNISEANVGDELHLDLEALKALPDVSFKTRTPWTEEQLLEFRGVDLKGLLAAAGAGSAHFTAVGVDDYTIEFQDIDLDKYPVIIAYEQNGKPMSLRQLGPLRIVFPFSDFPELNSESAKAMAVWQLVRMTVR